MDWRPKSASISWRMSVSISVWSPFFQPVHGEFLTPTRRDSITLKTRGHKPKPEGRYANVKKTTFSAVTFVLRPVKNRRTQPKLEFAMEAVCLTERSCRENLGVVL